MPSDKIRRSRIVRGSKRSRVPIKSALKKRKMEAEKESITTMPHPAARQIFARLDPGRGQDQCAKKKRVLSCDFQHGIDSFHGIAQIV